MRKWANKLLDTGTLAKSTAAQAYWCSSKNIEGETVRTLVSGDEELEKEMQDYWSCRTKLLKDMSWAEANKVLWNTFGCCYYSCKFLGLSAFDALG